MSAWCSEMPDALVRYLDKSIKIQEFRGHSAEWESRCIIELMSRMGYRVDVANWKPIVPIDKKYDATFDIVSFQGLSREGRRHLHLTEPDSGYALKAESERVGGRNLPIRRSMPDSEIIYKAIEEADSVTLVGNDWTLSTYPERYRNKIQTVNVSASYLGDIRKSVLYKYIGSNLDMDDSWRGHASKWAYACIAKLFIDLGYDITPLDWNATYNGDGTKYDAVCAIGHMVNIADAIGEKTFKMFRLINSDPLVQNRATIARHEEAVAKKGDSLPLDEICPDPDAVYKTLDIADFIAMNGNDYILGTFPEKYRAKMTPINVAASNIGNPVIRENIANRKHFIWHYGWGAIRKGFDLVVEAFAKHPDWELSIVSKVQPEVLNAYQDELRLPNIRYYGWIDVSHPVFQSIARSAIGFVGPSCAEGQSPAVATCLQLGLYPIISRQNGITLPEGCGMYLDELTVEDIERKVSDMLELSDKEVVEQIQTCQTDALVRYSRAAYRDTMRKHLERYLCKN